MDTGKINTLEVLKEVDFGIYLDGEEAGEILMPKRYVPENTAIGERIDAFIYRDSEDRLIATTVVPKILAGDCAFLTVEAVNKIGAFLDWGLPKDLLVPYNQMAEPMEAGKSYVVYAYVDERTNRVAASSKLSLFLKETGEKFQTGQEVELMIVARSELGYKAVIDGTHLGLIFHSNITSPVNIGQRLPGYIQRVRKDDRRIDLAIDVGRALPRKAVQSKITDQIIKFLEANRGISSLTDKSSPEQIMKQFGVSKGDFKKALGALYKQKQIEIDKHQITLIKNSPGE